MQSEAARAEEPEVEANERMARMEETLRGVRDRIDGLQHSLERLDLKLEGHMASEEQERRQWSQLIAGLSDRISTLPSWQKGIHEEVRSLKEWRDRTLGALAVMILLIVPIVLKWAEHLFLK